jgi:pyruvate-formate lyase-activating enzyme
MNSVREECYEAYFRPQGYSFTSVLNSIDTALAYDKFVAINYLNCPGFSDTPEEVDALVRFLEKHPIHMIQWRNLNFDPIRYWKEMDNVAEHGRPIGMEKLLDRIRKEFPKLKFGYFNPPKEVFGKK